MLLKSLLLILLLSNLACSEQKESDYKKTFFLKALVDNSNKSQLNPQTTCQENITAMQSCASTASEFSSFTLTETIFVSTISSRRYVTYTDYCNNLIVNEPYKNQSDSLKVCFLKCDLSYWQTRRNLNICNESFASMIQGSFSDSGTTSCKRNCISPTNNNP